MQDLRSHHSGTRPGGGTRGTLSLPSQGLPVTFPHRGKVLPQRPPKVSQHSSPGRAGAQRLRETARTAACPLQAPSGHLAFFFKNPHVGDASPGDVLGALTAAGKRVAGGELTAVRPAPISTPGAGALGTKARGGSPLPRHPPLPPPANSQMRPENLRMGCLPWPVGGRVAKQSAGRFPGGLGRPAT